MLDTSSLAYLSEVFTLLVDKPMPLKLMGCDWEAWDFELSQWWDAV